MEVGAAREFESDCCSYLGEGGGCEALGGLLAGVGEGGDGGLRIRRRGAEVALADDRRLLAELVESRRLPVDGEELESLV